jgi:non-canonical poly(A) RNA polymerase PAPD5/7
MEEENTQTVLYETLSPLSLSISGHSPLSDDLKPYSVFRNEISLAVLNPDSRETAAPDYFSLDVGGEDSERIAAAPEPEPKTPAREAATPTLERGWFRGNCRFKSPMLQLHKGTEFGFCYVQDFDSSSK